MKFNKEQKKSGYNKHGHYQFGNQSCPGCKSDDTFICPDYKDKSILECSCGFKFKNLSTLSK